MIVDPARVDDYGRYRGATLVTPNRPEAELATGLRIETPEHALLAGRRLVEAHGLGVAFVTIDRDGIAIVAAESPDDGCIAPAIAREVYDITGAGDMVVVMTGLCQAAGWSYRDTARMANMAAGLEIEQLGIAPVTWQQLATRSLAPTSEAPEASTDARCHPSLTHTDDKVVTLAELTVEVAQHRAADRSIVFTNGRFDLLHVGHAKFLEHAAQLGDVLIVAVNSDASVRRLKGASRPIIPHQHRARLLAALASVAHVVVFDEDTPHALLHRLRPDVLVKGGTTDAVVGNEVVAAYGGHIRVTDTVISVSTSAILAEINKSNPMTLRSRTVVCGSTSDPDSHDVDESVGRF